MNTDHLTETESKLMLRALRNLIANDGYAMTFQSTQQYRTALLNHFVDLVGTPDEDNAELPSQRAPVSMFLRPQVMIFPLDGDQQDRAQVAALAKPGAA